MAVDPYLMERNPYTGAFVSVLTSMAKLVAAGCDPTRAYASFQEYFEKLRDEPARWGKPFAALLGALSAQLGLGVAAIGGKDSMSGSFLDLDVPPTLISFAIAPAKAEKVLSPDLRKRATRCISSRRKTPWTARRSTTASPVSTPCVRPERSGPPGPWRRMWPRAS